MSRFTCDPTLTGNLTAEYEALQNDLEQAKLLAADYQNQLSNKTNDYAALKRTLEKTFGDLEKLQSHIIALREERHKLANEVMKVVSLEAKLAAAEAKIASLTDELERGAHKGKRGAAARREEPARREQIEVSFADDKLMEIIPTPADPKPFKGRG